MKSYFRYAPEKAIGLITTPECNAIYDSTGKLAFTGATQSVGVWNIRQATQTKTLDYDKPNYPYTDYGDVVTLARSPDKSSICAGYTTGEARLFNYVTGALTATFRGHRSAITSIAFDQDSGVLLATGGADCDIIVWDLVALTGVVRFHEHKDGITSLGFMQKGDRKFLISASKDTLLKVWDFDTKHCIQTIVGHRSEIWSLAILSPPNEPDRIRVFTGSADELIRGYMVDTTLSEDDAVQETEILKYYGSIPRSSGQDRCQSLAINSSGTFLSAQAAGKYVDLYKIRDAAETKKKMKRRVKRVKAKAANATEAEEEENDEDHGGETTTATNEITLSDEVELHQSIKFSAKVRSFAFNPLPPTPSEDFALVSLITNALEIYKIPHNLQLGAASKASVIDLQGHRSDVRCLAVSNDGNVIASSSSESIKSWNSRSLNSTGSCTTEGYCISIAFVPGGRYIIAGFKDGKLQIFDFASGESVFTDEEAHEGAAIWSIAVRPDGKGFSTASADKYVKCWSFNLTNDQITAEAVKQLQLPSDILCVRYNQTRSVNRLLLAVGLLDNTVRVFYEDSLKLFLTLYGHKLPVMSLDMSYDSTILISGSADKTIKIWGMDFGDCHRSLFAHEDSVTCVKFQPETHYFFSCSKDGMIKYWDADRFEQILFFTGHRGSIWHLEISGDGSTVYTCGQDRSIRVWTRGEDLVFLEEEKERLLEAQVDKSIGNDANVLNEVHRGIIQYGMNEENNASNSLTALNPAFTIMKNNPESLKGSELLIQAIDLIEEELPYWKQRALTLTSTNDKKSSSLSTTAFSSIPPANVMLLGLTPYQYLQRTLKRIKTTELESVLLLLPYHYVKRLLILFIDMMKYGLEMECCCKCAVFLIICHQAQITNTTSFLPELLELKDVIVSTVTAYRDMIGQNAAGFLFMQRMMALEREESQALSDLYGAEPPGKKRKV